jgi:c-di-GMP-binding flagellar brake protein YcgR
MPHAPDTETPTQMTSYQSTIKCSPTELSRCLVDSHREVVSILATLQKAGCLVTAYFGGGNNFILTSILAVMPQRDELILDYGSDSDANLRALKATRITFVTSHEQIKMQFYTSSLRHAHFEGRDAFSTPIPDALLRLQRREFYRIATPLTQPLKCVIAPQGTTLRAPTEATIVDISCGGIAIIAPSDVINLEPGMSFRGCRIKLPELGPVLTDAVVKNTYEVMLKNGTKHKQAGCEFVNMPERERAKIQRYINLAERERKDRAGGR